MFVIVAVVTEPDEKARAYLPPSTCEIAVSNAFLVGFPDLE